jgi:hypothetical protein
MISGVEHFFHVSFGRFYIFAGGNAYDRLSVAVTKIPERNN